MRVQPAADPIGAAAKLGEAGAPSIYGAVGTGVFCRLGCCAAPGPREQLRFFSSPGQAARAGFRPCLQCRPDADHALEAVRQRLELSEGPVTLSSLADWVGISDRSLVRRFRRALGVSPPAYARAVRVGRLKQALQDGQSVTDAIYQAGFGSSRALYERTALSLGMKPGQYRRRGGGLEIRYGVVGCSLGALLVAATDLGVCAVKLGAEEEGLAAELEREFCAASICRDQESTAHLLEVVRQMAEGQDPGVRVPLDLQGTLFQWRVWQRLQRIPRGQTASYGEIADDLGLPRGARAVARACASNQVALIVPCHRVVPAAGDSGGYRWGAERKRRILSAEREPAAQR